MDGDRKPATDSRSLCLLPPELLHSILFRLTLPDVLRLRSVSTTMNSATSCEEFRSNYNKSSSENWLFVYKKQPPKKSILYGFNDACNRWFQIPVADYLFQVVSPAEDLYFLAASGGFFLFALNNSRELLIVNLTSKTARKIPVSPLGPRDTSSWRRSGMKLVSGEPRSESFKFLFAEQCGDRPVLFVYFSEFGTWKAIGASETVKYPNLKESVFLSVVHRRNENVVVCVGRESDTVFILRPRFAEETERLAVVLIAGYTTNRLHVYGDGRIVVVKSEALDDKSRVVKEIELWGLNCEYTTWELSAGVPIGLIEFVKKPYEVMMGCLEERLGFVRVVLVSNFKGNWDLVWLSYDLVKRDWKWVPLPECKGMKGLNMAGLAFSSPPPLGS